MADVELIADGDVNLYYPLTPDDLVDYNGEIEMRITLDVAETRKVLAAIEDAQRSAYQTGGDVTAHISISSSVTFWRIKPTMMGPGSETYSQRLDAVMYKLDIWRQEARETAPDEWACFERKATRGYYYWREVHYMPDVPTPGVGVGA